MSEDVLTGCRGCAHPLLVLLMVVILTERAVLLEAS